MPGVTVVIAARPDQAAVLAVPAAQALDYPPHKLEIILARGKQPSAQRNAAIRTARGELIYFLDDDSVPAREYLSRAVPLFDQSEVKMVGGPNLCPGESPELEQVFALVLASWAFASSRARYSPVGSRRQTSEKELILCNLLARRDALLELGGFNEALYPNEENALMDELQKRGGKLIYDPEFFVFRRPRRTLSAFTRMLMTYGRGRAEQFRLHPTTGSALNFVPPLFLIYLLSLFSLPWLGPLVFLPLLIYFALVLVQAAVFALSAPGFEGHGPESPKAVSGGRRIFRSLAVVPLMFLTHVLYGVGFWRGLFTRLEKPHESSAEQVTLEHLKKL